MTRRWYLVVALLVAAFVAAVAFVAIGDGDGPRTFTATFQSTDHHPLTV